MLIFKAHVYDLNVATSLQQMPPSQLSGVNEQRLPTPKYLYGHTSNWIESELHIPYYKLEAYCFK